MKCIAILAKSPTTVALLALLALAVAFAFASWRGKKKPAIEAASEADESTRGDELKIVRFVSMVEAFVVCSVIVLTVFCLIA